MTLIGGHIGLDVVRENSHIVKRLSGEGSLKDMLEARHALATEARFLKAMSKSGFTPELIEQHDDYIVETDVGDTELMHDGEKYRRGCIKALHEMRKRRVRHSDLNGNISSYNGPNIIIKSDEPRIIDWHTAHYIGDDPVDKIPMSDSFLLWRTVIGTMSEDTKVCDQPRIARRWLAVLGNACDLRNLNLPLEGKTYLDLGCFQGDFCAMAACEGMRATGVDVGTFRSGENSIEIATELWKGMDCEFYQAEITNWVDFRFDIVTLFSTWAYIVRDSGWDKALDLLDKITLQCGELYFETQLYGDGPGPEELKKDADVEEMLGKYGYVEKIATFPVWGRPNYRSVFKVWR